ncbi:MAG TPA: Gfo/Idh/MocA family oxidoreductase, partial [Lapillicoccus sp.]|nr:Gfo/Idh/MocA family oxidoreductase [Lapillicoccus sp.]
HGDRGSVVIDDDQLTYVHLADDEVGDDLGNQVDKYAETQSRSAAASRDPGQLSDAHRLQYLNILAALEGREDVRVDLETNRRSVAVITGAYESARTGKPVVLS